MTDTRAKRATISTVKDDVAASTTPKRTNTTTAGTGMEDTRIMGTVISRMAEALLPGGTALTTPATRSFWRFR